jgi:hypothetical protein
MSLSLLSLLSCILSYILSCILCEPFRENNRNFTAGRTWQTLAEAIAGYERQGRCSAYCLPATDCISRSVDSTASSAAAPNHPASDKTPDKPPSYPWISGGASLSGMSCFLPAGAQLCSQSNTTKTAKSILANTSTIKRAN